MPTNGGEEHVLGENTPLALALSKALGSAIVSESDTRSDCIKSSFINNKCNLYLCTKYGWVHYRPLEDCYLSKIVFKCVKRNNT